MMLRTAIVAALLASASSVAHAEDRTPASGAPFCEQRDDLQEYLMAMVKHDETWMKQLSGCAVLKGGIKIGIIEDYPGSDLGHVQKVRVFAGGTSGVGYILILNLGTK